MLRFYLNINYFCIYTVSLYVLSLVKICMFMSIQIKSSFLSLISIRRINDLLIQDDLSMTPTKHGDTPDSTV